MSLPVTGKLLIAAQVADAAITITAAQISDATPQGVNVLKINIAGGGSNQFVVVNTDSTVGGINTGTGGTFSPVNSMDVTAGIVTSVS